MSGPWGNQLLAEREVAPTLTRFDPFQTSVYDDPVNDDAPEPELATAGDRSLCANCGHRKPRHALGKYDCHQIVRRTNASLMGDGGSVVTLTLICECETFTN